MNLQQLLEAAAPTVLTSAATIFVGVQTFRSSRNFYAKQNHAIDLANYRLKFWGQYLKSTRAVLGSASPEYTQAKTYAKVALNRIEKDLNLELARLSYERQITLITKGRKDHHLKASGNELYVLVNAIFALGSPS